MKNSTLPPARTALITGASEGIGYELARLMGSEGWNLILTARREAPMRALADSLQSQNAIRVEVIPLDLAKLGAPQELFELVQSKNFTVNALINNAGFGLIGPFLKHDYARIEQLMLLNISALTALTRLFLPGMRERRWGRILNVGSVAGFGPMPWFAVYAASKAFVRSFSEALSLELAGTGITVTCLSPGPTRTGFSRTAGYPQPDRLQWGTMEVGPVARQAYDGMMAGRRQVIPGAANRILSLLMTKLPVYLTIRAAKKVMEKRSAGLVYEEKLL